MRSEAITIDGHIFHRGEPEFEIAGIFSDREKFNEMVSEGLILDSGLDENVRSLYRRYHTDMSSKRASFRNDFMRAWGDYVISRTRMLSLDAAGGRMFGKAAYDLVVLMTLSLMNDNDNFMNISVGDAEGSVFILDHLLPIYPTSMFDEMVFEGEHKMGIERLERIHDRLPHTTPEDDGGSEIESSSLPDRRRKPDFYNRETVGLLVEYYFSHLQNLKKK